MAHDVDVNAVVSHGLKCLLSFTSCVPSAIEQQHRQPSEAGSVEPPAWSGDRGGGGCCDDVEQCLSFSTWRLARSHFLWQGVQWP